MNIYDDIGNMGKYIVHENRNDSNDLQYQIEIDNEVDNERIYESPYSF